LPQIDAKEVTEMKGFLRGLGVAGITVVMVALGNTMAEAALRLHPNW